MSEHFCLPYIYTEVVTNGYKVTKFTYVMSTKCHNISYSHKTDFQFIDSIKLTVFTHN